MKAELTPKEFIQAVYINDLGRLVASDNPYVAFIVMAAGIEFLGKCIEQPSTKWKKHNLSYKELFDNAINELEAFKNYRKYLEKYHLFGSLRSGLLHFGRTDKNISLSSKMKWNICLNTTVA